MKDDNRGECLAPHIHPGFAQLAGLGGISDALLGRVKWSELDMTVDLALAKSYDCRRLGIQAEPRGT